VAGDAISRSEVVGTNDMNMRQDFIVSNDRWIDKEFE
jgi:hypothetical protein